MNVWNITILNIKHNHIVKCACYAPWMLIMTCGMGYQEIFIIKYIWNTLMTHGIQPGKMTYKRMTMRAVFLLVSNYFKPDELKINIFKRSLMNVWNTTVLNIKHNHIVKCACYASWLMWWGKQQDFNGRNIGLISINLVRVERLKQEANVQTIQVAASTSSLTTSFTVDI